MKLRALLLVGACLVISACGQSTLVTGPTTPTQPVGPSTAPNAGVSLGVNADGSGPSFSPASVTIPVGGTVEWTNEDSSTYVLAADDGSWTSESMDSEVTFSRTFTTAGTFGYHVVGRPEITGTIIVQ